MFFQWFWPALQWISVHLFTVSVGVCRDWEWNEKVYDIGSCENAQYEKTGYLLRCTMVWSQHTGLECWGSRVIHTSRHASRLKLNIEKNVPTLFLYSVRKPASIQINSPLFSFTFRFGVAFTYYGISLNVTGFGLNPHLTQLVFSCTELPGKLIVYFSLNVVGRRPCQMAAIILTGVCIFINIFVPNGKTLDILVTKYITQQWKMACVFKNKSII